MKRKGKVHGNAARGLIGILLVLGLLQGTVLVLSEPPPTMWPPTWTPPQIYKVAEETEVFIGDTVKFTVTVNNPASPAPPNVALTWYEVSITDVIPPALDIDVVVLSGSYDAYSVVGNTVVVTATTLAPGEWFSVEITCTLVSPVKPGLVITNTATLEYEDDTGDPGVPIVSDPVSVTVGGYWLFLPIVMGGSEEPPPTGCFPKLLEDPGVGDAPHGVAVNSAANLIYVANHQDHTLTTINGSTYGVIRTVPVGDGPNGVAYNPTNDRVYVANRNDSTVSVLTADGAAVVKTIDVGSLPDGVAVNEVTNRIYVANYGSNTVSVIDGVSNTVVQTPTVGSDPAMIAVNPFTNKAYVALNGGPGVAVIDGAGSVTQVDLFDSNGPYGIAVDTLNNLVYVATIDTGRIVVIDGSTDEFQGWVEIRRLSDGSLAPLRMIAVNPLIGPPASGGHIFATTASVDGGWNKFLLIPKGWYDGFARAYALELKEPREGIAFEPSTLRVFVPSRQDDLLAVYQDGLPVCPQNFVMSADYEFTVCVAGADGTCREIYTR